MRSPSCFSCRYLEGVGELWPQPLTCQIAENLVEQPHGPLVALAPHLIHKALGSPSRHAVRICQNPPTHPSCELDYACGVLPGMKPPQALRLDTVMVTCSLPMAHTTPTNGQLGGLPADPSDHRPDVKVPRPVGYVFLDDLQPLHQQAHRGLTTS